MAFDPSTARPVKSGKFDPSTARPVPRGAGTQAGLGVRAAIQGAVAPFGMFADAAGALANLGLQAAGREPVFYPTRNAVGDVLTAAGLPEPRTDAEQSVGRVVELGTGAATGAGGFGAASRFTGPATTAASRFVQTFAANPTQQVIAGTAAPAVGEMLRTAGVPGPWPTVAEVAVGMLTPSDAAISRAAESKRVGALIKGTGAAAATRTAPARAAGGAADLLTTEGRENIVGRVLRSGANDPRKAVAALGEVPSYVKGSRPTMGQASGDTGLLRLESIVENTVDLPGVGLQPGRMAGARLAANRARVEAVEKLRPVDAQFERLRQGINKQFEPRLKAVMAARKPTPTQPVLAEIDAILTTPGIRQRAELVGTLEYARERVEALGPKADPEDLQGIRQDLSELVEGKLKGAATRDGRAVGGGVRGLSRSIMRNRVISAIDDAIEAGAKGYRAKWLEPYAAARQALDRRNIVGDIAGKARTTAQDAEGLPILSAAGMDRAMRANAARVARLTPQQRNTLNRVRADLQRGARGNNATVQGAGSSTAKNIVGGASVASIIGRALGTGPQREPFPLGDKFRFLFGYTDQKINDLLIEAMLDPALGRKLLARANDEAAREAADALEDLSTKLATASSQTNIHKDR